MLCMCACVCVCDCMCLFVIHSYFSMDLLVNCWTRSFSLHVQPKYLFINFFFLFETLQYVLDFVCYLCIHNTRTFFSRYISPSSALSIVVFSQPGFTEWKKNRDIFISNILAVFVRNEIDRIYSMKWQMLSISSGIFYFSLFSFFFLRFSCVPFSFFVLLVSVIYPKSK